MVLFKLLENNFAYNFSSLYENICFSFIANQYKGICKWPECLLRGEWETQVNIFLLSKSSDTPIGTACKKRKTSSRKSEHINLGVFLFFFNSFLEKITLKKIDKYLYN